MSWLGLLNGVVLQWFFIRLFKAESKGVVKYWGILYFIVPLTGWGSKFKSIGKVKYYYFN